MTTIKTVDIKYSHQDFDRDIFVSAEVISIEISDARVSVVLEDGYNTAGGHGSTLEEAVRDAGRKLHK